MWPTSWIKSSKSSNIITYSIETAIKTKLFNKIIVSTDSQKIANIAKKAGAEVPFLRPKSLSDDFTPLAPIFLHTLKWCINKGFDRIRKKKVNSVFSVTTFNYPIFRALKKNSKGYF